VAVVKPINSGASLEISINYVLRTDKTETRLTSGLLCIPELALEQMNDTKELWGKAGGRQFKHFVQAFSSDDRSASGGKLTVEMAHAIGIKFAEKMFPGFEILVATHKDTLHTHTHFIVNSVNLETGTKIQNSYHDLKAMRDYSDELCRQHGLAVLEEWSYANKGKSHSKKSEEIAKRAVDRKYKSHKFDCYRAVLAAVNEATSRDNFILKMKQAGWETEWSDKKHITFTNHENPKHKNRYATLAAEYENYKAPDILGEHEQLPLDGDNFKEALLARFVRNAEPPVIVEKPKAKPKQPAPLSRQERDKIKSRITVLKRWITATENRKKYKPIDDELKRLRDKPTNIFNRKSIENEIRDYEYRHKPQLSVYLEALTILPEKVTPKKWQAELNELQKILVPVPEESISERLIKSREKANEFNRKRELRQTERNRKVQNVEI
jgi:hypothetical protein